MNIANFSINVCIFILGRKYIFVHIIWDVLTRFKAIIQRIKRDRFGAENKHITMKKTIRNIADFAMNYFNSIKKLTLSLFQYRFSANAVISKPEQDVSVSVV